jgi:hypothetical protein
MTLMDAPKFDVRREKRNRNLLITSVVVVVVALIALGSWAVEIPWQVWHWRSDHRVNNFLGTVESGDLQKAYALWNNDPNWQQHPDQYKAYDFATFQKDWGQASDYGVIKSHKIVIAHRVGNGVVIGVNINGGKTPIFLRVDNKTKTIGFSPVELYLGP